MLPHPWKYKGGSLSLGKEVNKEKASISRYTYKHEI